METIEFHIKPDGKVFYRVDGGIEKKMTKFSSEVFHLLGIIENRFPECYARLAEIYGVGDNPTGKINDKVYRMLERFVRCNFGEYDLLTGDMEGVMLNFEEVKCPLRGGFCPDENIICKPKSLVRLSSEETKVAKMYLHGYTCDEIASNLNKQASTIKVQLFRITKKLHVRNAREIIKVLRLHNF